MPAFGSKEQLRPPCKAVLSARAHLARTSRTTRTLANSASLPLELLDVAQHRGRVDPQASPPPRTCYRFEPRRGGGAGCPSCISANPFGNTDYGSLNSLGLPK